LIAAICKHDFQLLRGFFVLILFGNKVYGVAANGEGLFGSAGGLEAHAGGISLPGGDGAGGIRSCVFYFVAGAKEKLFQNWLAAADLGNDGVEFFAVVRETAVCRIVAVPTGGRIESVELGKVDRRDVAGDAVDEQPSSALPLPVRRRVRLLGKTVIEAEGAADNE